MERSEMEKLLRRIRINGNAVLIGIGIVIAFLIINLPMLSTDAVGVNVTTSNATSKAYIWNTEPWIYNVTITPSYIDLIPGNSTQVNCTASIYDFNGWTDINVTNATFYNIDTATADDSTDHNNVYFSSDCACTQLGTSGTNASCVCSFDVWYYAYNGSWTCNFSAMDKGGNATARWINLSAFNLTTVDISPIIGINTQDEVDFGNLSVTERSDSKSINITNWGNVPINVTVWGYGGTDATIPGVGNYSFMCEYGNISNSYSRYGVLNTTSFEDRLNLTNSSTPISGLTLPARVNDVNYGNDTNMTYWQIEIPQSVGGICNGTIVFSAVDIS